MANGSIETLAACNGELYYDAKKTKDEKRISNVIIRGILKVDDEKMYVTMNDLFKSMQSSFTYIGTHGVTRLGRAPKQPTQNVVQGHHTGL